MNPKKTLKMHEQKRIIKELKNQINEEAQTILREYDRLQEYLQRYNLDFEVLREMRALIKIHKKRKERLERQLQRFTQKRVF